MKDGFHVPIGFFKTHFSTLSTLFRLQVLVGQKRSRGFAGEILLGGSGQGSCDVFMHTW